VLKGSLKKHVIYNPLGTILGIFKTTKDWKIIDYNFFGNINVFFDIKTWKTKHWLHFHWFSLNVPRSKKGFLAFERQMDNVLRFKAL
jgi:hypothetical protein